VTSECSDSTATPPETVAKQFLHLSNHSVVTVIWVQQRRERDFNGNTSLTACAQRPVAQIIAAERFDKQQIFLLLDGE